MNNAWQYKILIRLCRASQVVLVVKNLPASAGDIRDVGSIPGPGRSPGGGCANPHQYYCLENPKDRGAWRPTIHRVTKSQTRLKWLSIQGCCGKGEYFCSYSRRQHRRVLQHKLTVFRKGEWQKEIFSVYNTIGKF